MVCNFVDTTALVRCNKVGDALITGKMAQAGVGYIATPKSFDFTLFIEEWIWMSEVVSEPS